jgi:hypothetical protein
MIEIPSNNTDSQLSTSGHNLLPQCIGIRLGHPHRSALDVLDLSAVLELVVPEKQLIRVRYLLNMTVYLVNPIREPKKEKFQTKIT